MRSFCLLCILSLLLCITSFSQPNYWQQRTTAVGFNVGINPLNPATIYCERTAGTLSVSRDRGAHWTDLPGAPGVSGIRHILVHPRDTLTIFVCEFFNLGLMKTTDEGATWHVVLANYGIDGESIDYDPVHPDTMYAGKFSDGAVYRSVDRGENWTLQGISGPNLCGLIVRPDSADILYAGTGASRISKSTDRGVTWRLVNDGGAEEVPKFAINPAHPRTAYATTYGEPDSINHLWKTTDGGETWFKTALEKIGIWSLAIDAQHPETLYVGRFGETRGIEKTTDGGATWQHFEGGLLNNFAAWNLRVHPLSPGDVWVAGTENFFGAGGIFEFVTAPLSSARGHVYTDRNANGRKDSSEHGAAGWKLLLTGAATDSALTDSAGAYAFTNLVSGSYSISLAPKTGWAGTRAGSLSLSLPPAVDSAGRDFGVLPLPVSALRAGWNLISVPVVAPEERVVALFPTATSRAFSYDKMYVAGDSMRHGVGYWLKSPGPDTVAIPGAPSGRDTIPVQRGWNIVGAPSVPAPVAAVTSIPGGIVTSQFFGYTTSYAVADTLLPAAAYWVKVNAAGMLVLSSSVGAGNSPARIAVIPTRELPPPSPAEDHPAPVAPRPQNFSLGQNFPNPFNPASTIRYDLPAASQVRVAVYSVLGELVAVLTDGVREAGEYRVVWDAAGRASGVYYCRIEARSLTGETFREVRKMLLLR
jgi:hypothetical protein